MKAKRPIIGDTITLASPTMRPRYLNGATVKVTGCTADTRGGGFYSEDDRRWFLYDGIIQSMVTPRPNGRFRVGQHIRGIRDSMIEQVTREQVAA